MSNVTDLLALRSHLVERIAEIDAALEREEKRLCADPDPLAGLEMFAGAQGTALVKRSTFPSPNIIISRSDLLEKLAEDDRQSAEPEAPVTENTPPQHTSPDPKHTTSIPLRARVLQYYHAHPDAIDAEIAEELVCSVASVALYRDEAKLPPRGQRGGYRKKAGKSPDPVHPIVKPAPGTVAIKPVAEFSVRTIDTMREALQELGGRISKWTRGDGSAEWLLDGQPASENKIISAARKQALKRGQRE